MSVEHITLDQPNGARERIVYEMLTRHWGMVILDGAEVDPFELEKGLGVAFDIDPLRMLALNWSAHQDISEIDSLQGYIPKHAA